MIASPANGANQHVEVLAELSSRLIEEGFIKRLLAAPTPAAAAELFYTASVAPAVSRPADQGLLIGVTGCPTGVARTYLAAEALEKTAAELGYEIKVETNGAIGVKNRPSAEEIARAKAVIVASDRQVEMARFAGKPLLQTGVKAPIHDGKAVIEKALHAHISRIPASSNVKPRQKRAACAANCTGC